MVQVPQFLAKAGMSWRYAEPADLRFIVSSWFCSTFKAFVEGPGCPVEHLKRTVDTARATGNRGLLQAIWNAEGKRLFADRLAASPTIVVYSAEDPSQIVAWGHEAYCYTKLVYRKQGIATAIRAALANN